MEPDISEIRPPNHRASANFISAFFIWWTRAIFKMGYERDILEEDLPEPLDEHKASYLGNKISRLWSKEYYYAKSRKKVPSLSKVLIQCFVKEYLIYGMALAFIELLVKDTTLTYLYRLIYYHREQSQITMTEAVFFGMGVIICSLISVCVQHPYMLAAMHLGMKVRVACMSLMYRKTLRMSMLALCPSTVGNIINLMSNDATRFDIVTMFLHYLWISPLQLILFMFILYRHIGMSAIIGSLIIVLFIPIQMILAYFNKKLRWKTALKTDERVRLVNETISGIQVIKMYAWEPAFRKLIGQARMREMNILIKTSYIRGVVMSMIMFTARIAIFVSLISLVSIFAEKITPELVFVVSGYYIIMRASMTVFFPQGITQFAETLITIERTRDYLLNEDAIVGNKEILYPEPFEDDEPRIYVHPDKGRSSSAVSSMFIDTVLPSIRIIEAYARWDRRYVLRNVELIIKNSELVAIIGQVGSGKSSLLHVILKELPVCEGYVSIKGSVSFASGEPWLFAGSVRQNILFGHEFDRDRYKRVCRVCALLKDFQLLPYGDQTIVGERGTSLSGGQRARINLARCIYKEADIYVLDDPLSAVDGQVGNQIFEQCITNFLSGKIRVLVTHQLQYLHHVDQMVIMEKGRVIAKGTFHELQNSGLDFAQYLKSEEENSPPSPIIVEKEPVLKTSYSRSISFMESSMEAFYEEQQQRTSLIESRATGVVDSNLYKQYVGRGGNYCHLSTIISLFLTTQGIASASDYFIGQWTKIEETKDYKDISSFGITSTLSSNDCILSYSILTHLLLIVSVTRSFMFFYFCLRASIKLHDEMLESIVYARMKFFQDNSSGRILNRFSKDMGAVDEDLPYAAIDFFQMFLNLVGVFVVLSVTNYYLIIPIAIVVVGIYFLRQYYLKTSRSVKRLEGTVRSYVYAHLNASIQGLSTIRSHEAEEVLTYEFDKHMDLHSSAWYLFIATARAFSIWTDMMCVSLIILVSLGFLFLEQVLNLKISAGDVGLSVTQCLTLTGLIPWGMRQSAEMENHMTSVERINEFIDIDRETMLRSPPNDRPHPLWPEGGEIIFHDTGLRYNLNEPPVLKNLNFVISPEEKIGIVGRTGAGKSSLISALFRLAFESGRILIDGVDIFKIGLHDLREKIAIIPQEPIIFTGTVRFNLDPYHQYTDESLLAALSIVELETNSRNILNKSLTEGGANYSAGQKQLLCLARAIVRNNKILILDEATANMDPRTDRLIQTTIRLKFAKCTVLTIAHRLNTIMDSDRVLVMHAGSAIEFEHPHILLQSEEGFFTAMVNQTGKTTAQFLRKIAEDNYKQKQQPATSYSSTFLEEEIF